MQPENKPVPATKTRAWTLPTVLGLIIGVVGAVGVIELRPQLGVSPQEPIEKLKPFSTPFGITNTGYLSFFVEHVYCYVHQLSAEHRNLSPNVLHFNDWDDVNLDRGDGGTIICDFFPVAPPKVVADIVIIIDYKPFRQFPVSFRKYFRFKGAYVDNWQWIREPSTGIEAQIDNDVARIITGHSN